MKGNFWFCFRRFRTPKRASLILSLSVALFSVPCGGEARPVTAFGGSFNVRSHFAITSHRHARIHSRRLLGTCFVFAPWLRSSLVVTHSSGLCKAQTILYVLAPPAQCAHKFPPFSGNILKRRELLPNNNIKLNLFSYLQTTLFVKYLMMRQNVLSLTAMPHRSHDRSIVRRTRRGLRQSSQRWCFGSQSRLRSVAHDT